MLRNIQAVYFIKIIFYHLFKKTLLKLIKYNKDYQKVMKLKLDNFKRLTGKLIIYETNKKGKEYNRNGELIYEGEFLNGERNGKGKEYNNKTSKLYEGGYLKGKKNGLGKEYYFGQEFIFEGEYLNGKRWNGKGYDENNKITKYFIY